MKSFASVSQRAPTVLLTLLLATSCNAFLHTLTTTPRHQVPSVMSRTAFLSASGYSRCRYPRQHKPVQLLSSRQFGATILPITMTNYNAWRVTIRKTKTEMKMIEKMFDFLSNRSNDFEKLDSSSSDTFGPGPLLLLYNCPDSIVDEEIQDMITDGAPLATSKGRVAVKRLSDDDSLLLEMTLADALDHVIAEPQLSKEDATVSSKSTFVSDTAPVLYFSGISNAEMLATYRIISREIYQETGGVTAACAKAVKPAMGKSLRQVFEEICGDHLDATSTPGPRPNVDNQNH